MKSSRILPTRPLSVKPAIQKFMSYPQAAPKNQQGKGQAKPKKR